MYIKSRKTNFKHFLTPDHIAFLLILPAMFFNKGVAVLIWFFALFYDIAEIYFTLFQKIERYFKE